MLSKLMEAAEKNAVWGSLAVGIALWAFGGWVYASGYHVEGVALALIGTVPVVIGVMAFSYWFGREVKDTEQASLRLEPLIIQGSERGTYGTIWAIRAQLKVSSVDGKPLKDCRVRLMDCKLLYDTLWIQEFKGQHPYLRWSGKPSDDESCDIHTSHTAEIAFGSHTLGGPYIPGARSAVDGQFLAVRTPSGTYPVSDGHVHRIQIEITASNAAPLVQDFKLLFSDEPVFEFWAEEESH